MSIDLTIYKNDVETSFSRIASELMNDWVIQVESNQYRIAELEFYYWSEFHDDPYAHKHTRQKEMGRWYFHGSGLDLTFGENGSYGGILIRAIYDFKGKVKNYIYGPLNCLTELFSKFPCIYDNKSNISFGLVKANENDFEREVPISGPRFGLNPINDKDQKCDAPYRFLIMPKYRHDAKQKIVDSLDQRGLPCNIWG